MNRRQFVSSMAAACVGSAVSPRALVAQRQRVTIAETLNDRFPDLARHFIFEYYPWYRADPWFHWDAEERRPPIDLASNYMPQLGAYDSRAVSVIEQHAKWIAESGAGAINLSWWGRRSSDDAIVHTLMDVMRAHGIRVAFHLEPYDDRHPNNYASDIEYLIREYGDRRRWDTFLLLTHADGKVGPVFKSFKTILPDRSTDCHGVTSPVADYVPDNIWHQQTDLVRQTFARDFDRITLLADSLSINRTKAGGFDGIAIYDNFVQPDTWGGHARNCSDQNLVFSFNVNPGYDGLLPRTVPPPDSCFSPLPFAPGGGAFDWARASERQRAADASLARMRESFRTTIDLQTSPLMANAKRGFFLVYLNSFNEWHEGHQFEPMKDEERLTAAERAIGYHNPSNGRYRLDTLKHLLETVIDQ